MQVDERTNPARDINFDPLILPDGISPPDDPLLSARSVSYAQSFFRREGEPKNQRNNRQWRREMNDFAENTIPTEAPVQFPLSICTLHWVIVAMVL